MKFLEINNNSPYLFPKHFLLKMLFHKTYIIINAKLCCALNKTFSHLISFYCQANINLDKCMETQNNWMALQMVLNL